jgi:phospholipid/cholesterol/gamma-HCH transport system permease protein
MAEKTQKAQGVETSQEGEVLRLRLFGEWSLYTRRPSFEEVLASGKRTAEPSTLVVDCGEVEEWDSQLLLFLLSARMTCQRRNWKFCPTGLPEGVENLLGQVPEARRPPETAERRTLLEKGEQLATHVGKSATDIFRFTGDIVVSAGRVIARPHRFRWGDALEAMQQTGAMALPIVGLISFLVGVIMAFQASIQLRQFGAEIFVANLVGLAVVREMGPMMAAVVLCGRTGAAFAAQIGTMKVNEEIDALRTLGASPVDFLVMPRMVALFLMMPLLAIYANFLGILGGLFVGVVVMEMTVNTYLSQTREAIALNDVYSGLIKALFFGVLIAFAGCLRGMQCKLSSAGVGAAATSAVVTGILLVIIADALFAVIFDRLGI